MVTAKKSKEDLARSQPLPHGGIRLYAAVAPACYGLYLPFQRFRWGGRGYFVDFFAQQIKEFCLKKRQ